MQIIIKTAHHTWRWTLRFCIYLLLATALLLAILRLSLPLLADYRAEIEQRIGEHINLPVRIEQLHITWWGWGPALEIDGFSLLDPVDARVRFGFRRALIGLDMLRSLLSGRLIWQQISLQGGELTLQWSQQEGLRLLPGAQTGATIPPQELLAWLFKTHTLDLRFEQLSIQRDAAPPIQGGELLLSLRGGQRTRHLNIALTLPGAGGNRLQIATELKGQAEHPEQWQASFYMRGNGLNLTELPLTGSWLDSGSADIELWGSWEQDHLSEIVAQTRFTQLQLLNAPAGSADPDDFALDWQWHPDTTGWQLQGRLSDTGNTSGDPPGSMIDIHRRNTVQQPRLEGSIEQLPLQRLTPLAAVLLPQAQQELLQQLAPAAQLNKLSFLIPDNATPWQLSARFDDLQIQPRGRIPGISGLSGELNLTRDNGWLALSGPAFDVHWNLLPETLTIDRLQGMIEWQRQQDDWRLTSTGLDIANADLTARLRGSVGIPSAGGKPVLDLRIDYSNVDIARIYRYLPAEILKPKLLEWLNDGLVGGRIPFGGTVLTGDTADFPFDDGKGLFETRFLVEDMILDYKPGWPRIEQLAAEVVFRNDSLAVNAQSGRILDVALHEVTAQIERFKIDELAIHGVVRGPGASMLRFVQESPLRDNVGRALQGFELTKNNDLDLSLLIPLKKEEEKNLQVKGVLSFAGNQLTIPQHRIELADMHGQLTFTKDDLSADDLDLRFRGDPARLSISTRQQTNDDAMFRFQLQGQLGLNALLDQQAESFTPYFSGRSRWDVVLNIPKRLPTQGSKYSIDIQSDMAGMSVLLPQPLAKAAAVKRELKGHLDIDDAGMDLRLDYAPDAQAAIRLLRDNDGLHFDRGELRISAGTAELPAAPGLHTIAELEQFELALIGGGKPLPAWFKTVQARIAQLTLGSLHLADSRVTLVNENDEVDIQLNGEDIGGHIHIPAVLDNQHPIQAQLDHLQLHLEDNPNPRDSRAETVSTSFDPRRFPPLQLLAEDVRLDNRPLGQLALLMTPYAQGLNLEQLELQSGQHRLSAKGDWRVLANEQQQSRIEAHIYTPALGETLKTLGYNSLSISGAEVFADLAAAWPGPLNDFSLKTFQGSLDLQIKKGQFLELDPGLGRVVGLFNLATLTRRLRLDFTDLFSSGLVFDSISGRIDFRDGRAQTDDLLLQGPSANILLSGSIGLARRDFRQTVTIMPQLGSSLALAGALTGGPAIGAAVFLAGQIFKSKLDKVIAYRYSLTGSWDDPKVEILKQQDKYDSDETGFGQR